MPIPPRELTPDQRAAVVEDIRANAGTADGSVRIIAARHQLSMRGVRIVAEQNGLADAWSSGAARTAAATAVNIITNAELRADIERGLLEDVQELRDRLLAEVTHLHVVKDQPEGDGWGGEHVEHTTLPAGPAEWRATMSAIGTAMTAANNIARLTAESAVSGQATGLLDAFATELTKAAAVRRREQDTTEGP